MGRDYYEQQIARDNVARMMLGEKPLPMPTKRKKKTTLADGSPTESAILDALINWCYAQKLWVWRNNSGMLYDRNKRPVRYGLVGSADIIGIAKPHGRAIFIEAKSVNGVQSPQQVDFQRRAEECGALYIVARSVDDLEARKAEIVGRV